MQRAFFKILAIITLALSATYAQSLPAKQGGTPWHFGAGISAGRLTPVMIEAMAGYKAATLHISGGGFHKGPNDFWCGIRGTLAYRLFYTLPFSIEAGVSGGYEFAEAPNEIHKAMNKANNANLLYPYNYKEILDVSAAVRINLLGFFTQISMPVYNFMEHDAPRYNWRIGYLVEF